jgi:hypothetical protein
MKLHESIHGTPWLSAGLLSSATLVAVAGVLHAGGAEVTCAGPIERWGPPMPISISWYATTTPTAPYPAALGYPGTSCTPTTDITQEPGIQSIVEAAKAWRYATMPGIPPQQNASNISTATLATSPVGLLQQGPTTSYFDAGNPTTDGRNVVTLLEPPSTFNTLGAQFAYAITAARIPNASNGKIVEADIAINAQSEASAGLRRFSFAEYNTALTETLFTEDTSSGTPTFMDLQGTMTQMFGYFLGLGNTLVESEYTMTTTPTVNHLPCMFQPVHSRPYTANGFHHVDDYNLPCDQGIVTVNPSGDRLWGEYARTLQRDDLCALGNAYPKTAFTSQLGAIEGRITTDGGEHPDAVHVLAILQSDPGVVRVGRLTANANGNYRIDGLPAGTYYVMAEPPDGARMNTQLTSPNFYNPFFADSSLPGYLQAGMCVPDPGWRLWKPDFYSVEQNPFPLANCEDRASTTVLPVTVTAGATTTGIDIHLLYGSLPGIFGTTGCADHDKGSHCSDLLDNRREDPVPLWVGEIYCIQNPPNGPYVLQTELPAGFPPPPPECIAFWSIRGIHVGPSFPVVFMVAPPTEYNTFTPHTCYCPYEGANVELRLSTTLNASVNTNNEIEQVPPTSVVFPIPPQTVTVTNGVALLLIYPFPLSSLSLPQNCAHIYVQAHIFGIGGQSDMLSNIVTVDIAQ